MVKQAKDTVDTADVKKAAKQKQAYPKEQIIASAKYSNRRDLLTVLLEEGRSYTSEQVEQIMNNWLKEGVR